MWAASYGISKDPQVEDGTLDYRKVANDLRREASQYTETTKASKIAKGSFGPTFAGEESSDESPRPGSEDATSRTKRASQKRKHSSGETPGMAYRVNEEQHPRQKRFKRSSGETPGMADRDVEELQTSKKRNHSSGETPGKVCRACEGPHPTRRCYYLFQRTAPHKWTPKPHVQKLVDRNLKEDSTLKEEIKQWTKKKDGGKNKLE